MKERVHQILESKSISASKLAEILDVQASGISHILSGRNKPSLDFIVKLLNSFPDISPDWFILGDGVMYRSEASPDTIATHTSNIGEIDLFTDGSREVNDMKDKAALIEEQLGVSAKEDNSDEKSICNHNKPLSKTPDSMTTAVYPNIHTSRKIRKVMVFYSDHTVESFTYTEGDESSQS